MPLNRARAGADEGWAVLADVAVSDSALLSVARWLSEAGDRNAPPLPPFLRGGRLAQNTRGGRLRLSGLSLLVVGWSNLLGARTSRLSRGGS